jgi:hypothetical protein
MSSICRSAFASHLACDAWSLVDSGPASGRQWHGAGQRTNKGKTMSETQAVAKVMTNLTCWSCGEESLKEQVEAVDPNAFRPANAIITAIMQSKCTKCGAQSINAAQAQVNKINARKSRKAFIKESNRNSA